MEKMTLKADICHAFQIMKAGGLKDENIIVFMYDDIAFNENNPRPGVLINHPQGGDVYAGVPKDYTGEDVTVNNLFAVLLGNKAALSGGSGKVVDSGPNDHIFVFYSDHGGPGVLGMLQTLSLFLLVTLAAWSYRAIRPPPKICGSIHKRPSSNIVENKAPRWKTFGLCRIWCSQGKCDLQDHFHPWLSVL